MKCCFNCNNFSKFKTQDCGCCQLDDDIHIIDKINQEQIAKKCKKFSCKCINYKGE